MRIRKLFIREFGKFKTETIEFNEDINIISGENEAGKTTIALFIRFMLYGIPKQRRKDEFSLRDRIIPFGSNCARGAMVIENEGTLYRIERYFGNNPRNDSFKVLKEKTNDRILISGEPGVHFLGFSESTFLRLIYMEEIGPEISGVGTEEIIDKLRNFAITGQNGVSFEGGLSLIEKRKKELSNTRNTGLIDILRDRNKYLEEKIREIRENKVTLNKYKEEIILEEEKLENLNHDKNIILKSHEDMDKIRSLENYEEALYLIRKKEDLILETKKLDVERPIRVNKLKEIKNESNELKSILLEMNKKISFHNKLVDDIKLIQEEMDKYPKSVLDEESSQKLETLSKEYIERRRKRYFLEGLDDEKEDEMNFLGKEYINTLKSIKNLESLKLEIVFLVTTIIIILLSILNDNKQLLYFALAPITSIIVVYFLRTHFLKKERKKSKAALQILKEESSLEEGEFFELLSIMTEEGFKIRKKDLKIEEKNIEEKILSILNESNSKDLGEYRVKRSEYANLEESETQCKEAISKLKEEIEKDRNYFEKKLNDIEEKYEAELKEVDGLNKVYDDKFILKLLEKIDSYEEKEKYEEQIRKVKEELKVISKDTDLNEVILSPKAYTKEKISEEIKKEKDILNRLEKINVDVNRINKNKDEIKAKIIILEEECENLVPYVSEVNENIKTMEEYHIEIQALDLASSTLKDIMEEMREEYLPRVSKKLSSFMEMMTKGEHGKFFLKEDFTLDVDNDGFTKSHRFMSKGTLDLLWLGLRITLCDIITDGKVYPLILDDTFLHIDDKRLKRVLSYLKDISEEYQIIIFTCHNREKIILEEAL